MNLKFKYGFYVDGHLHQVKIDLVTDKNYYKKLKKILEVKKVPGYELIRMGNTDKDGGYPMLKSFWQNNIAYSFGINNDVSWDDSMANLGYDIFMYDFTIDALPYERKEFHFFKEGIAGTNDGDPLLKTLKYFIDRNGHSKEKNMILKMDVEGWEWDFLGTVDTKTLNQFDQILIEFHDLVSSPNPKRYLKLLKKLNKTHQLVHIHGNNCSHQVKIGDTVFANVMEVTYVKKDKYNFADDEELFFPTKLDFPNDKGRPDVPLGYWNKPIDFEVK